MVLYSYAHRASAVIACHLAAYVDVMLEKVLAGGAPGHHICLHARMGQWLIW